MIKRDVSKRLGHREIRTTEIYTKIIDKKMKEASKLIPELSFDMSQLNFMFIGVL